MKHKTQFIAINLALVLLATVSVTRVLAQHSHDHNTSTSWKTGMLRIADSVWAGDVQLETGMYHVKHVVSGDKHWLVFKSVTLGAGYREGSMAEEQEVVRLECRVEPTEKSISNTKAIFRRNSEGKKSIQEIQIAGETVKHILLPTSSKS